MACNGHVHCRHNDTSTNCGISDSDGTPLCQIVSFIIWECDPEASVVVPIPDIQRRSVAMGVI